MLIILLLNYIVQISAHRGNKIYFHSCLFLLFAFDSTQCVSLRVVDAECFILNSILHNLLAFTLVKCRVGDWTLYHCLRSQRFAVEFQAEWDQAK